MRILRIVATPYVPAGEAKTQADPWLADPQAILAPAGTRLHGAYLVEMRAALSHASSNGDCAERF
jgi:hypothetical protein